MCLLPSPIAPARLFRNLRYRYYTTFQTLSLGRHFCGTCSHGVVPPQFYYGLLLHARAPPAHRAAAYDANMRPYLFRTVSFSKLTKPTGSPARSPTHSGTEDFIYTHHTYAFIHQHCQLRNCTTTFAIAQDVAPPFMAPSWSCVLCPPYHISRRQAFFG